MTERITQRGMHHSVLVNLQRSLARTESVQQRLSSGRQISRPSDSPSGTVSALRHRAELRRIDQHQRNATDGLGWLGTADTALTESLSLVRRARELALGGINASSGPQAREAMAAEVDVLRESLLALANTTHLGRPIFAGTALAAQAFDPATGAYLGDAGTVRRTVAPDVEVVVNVVGEEAFGGGAHGVDVFSLLGDLSAHLRAGDTAALSGTDLGLLDAATTRLQDRLATVGARYSHVTTMQDRAAATSLDLQAALAEVESIDLPATIMELQLQQVAYQAALGATARVVQPSLMDFLR
ncbi:MAG: flagellar hook-associated protein FlgL [Acidimicrobiia bacterium]